MKKIAILFTLLGAAAIFTQVNAQSKAKTVKLEQVPGEFVEKEVKLKEGNYVFEIHNNDVGHDVGFVLVKKGDDPSVESNHIQTAYVTKLVASGKKEKSKPTKLTKGEYIYFCPLNPTDQSNTIIVE